jgi:hypothetical protein
MTLEIGASGPLAPALAVAPHPLVNRYLGLSPSTALGQVANDSA